VKDGFVIRKPQKIHSRARARRSAEAKAKGRHTGYGASRRIIICLLGMSGFAVGVCTLLGNTVSYHEAMLAEWLPMFGLLFHRQAPRYQGGTSAGEDPLDPPHARSAPPAEEVPRFQEDRQAPLPRPVPEGRNDQRGVIAQLKHMLARAKRGAVVSRQVGLGVSHSCPTEPGIHGSLWWGDSLLMVVCFCSLFLQRQSMVVECWINGVLSAAVQSPRWGSDEMLKDW
jgi:hypothetical protein